MNPQDEDSKWADDSYITKFLEIFLKLKNEQNERDEDFTETDRRLPEYFSELQEGLTAYDVKFEMIKIRRLYKKEALELLKSGKSQNESKLPWFSTAKSLFSHTVNWEKEIERDQNIKSSDSSAGTSDSNLANIHCEERKSSPQPPAHKSFPSKNAIVTSMVATTSVLPAVTSSLISATTLRFVANSKPYTDRELSTATVPFASSNSVLTSSKFSVSTLDRRRTKAKLLIIDSPFVMNANSSEIYHPLSPPPFPASRIPLRRTTRNFSSNTAFTSIESRLLSHFISVLEGTNPLPITISSTRISSTTPYSAEFSPSLTVTSRSYQTPCSATITYSLSKHPIFKTTPSPSARHPLVSDRSEVPLLRVASSYKSRIPIPQTTRLPRAKILTTDATSLKARQPFPYKHPPPYRASVHLPSATTSQSSALTSVPSSSQERVLKSVAPSSEAKRHILHCDPHQAHRQRLPLSSTVSPSWFKAPNSHNSSHSKANDFMPTVPSSNTSNPTSATVFSSASDFISSRPSIRTSSPSSSRKKVSKCCALSCTNVLKSASSSSRDEVLKKTASSSSDPLPSSPHLEYKSKNLSSTLSPSWFRSPRSRNSSFKTGVLTSIKSSSRDKIRKLTAPSSTAVDLASATVPPSARAFTSSKSSVLTSTSSQGVASKVTAPSSRERLLILPSKSPKSRSPNTRDLMPAIVSVSPWTSAFRSSRSNVLTSPPSFSRYNVPKLTASSRSNSASSSSWDEVHKTSAPSSSEGLHILPHKTHQAYKQRTPLSTTVSPSLYRVPPSRNSSSKVGVFTPSPSYSRKSVLESTTPSSKTRDLPPATVCSSASGFASSHPSSRTEISFSQTTSTSITGISLSPPSYRNVANLSSTDSNSGDENFYISTTENSISILKREKLIKSFTPKSPWSFYV